MIKLTGGDNNPVHWSVNDEFYFTSPIQAALKSAMIDLELELSDVQRTNGTLDIDWTVEVAERTLKHHKIESDEAQIRKVFKYWLK